MKKIMSLFVVIACTMFATHTFAQKFSTLDKSPMDVAAFPSSYRVSDKVVKVIYSRPQLKGRSFSKLVKNDKVWRTGANEAVEITFYKDVVFGGQPVKAGTYSLFTIPGQTEWTIILSTATNVWGSYMYTIEEDVVRVKGTVSKSETPLEAFSIVFEGEQENFTMYLGWGTVIVSVPVKG